MINHWNARGGHKEAKIKPGMREGLPKLGITMRLNAMKIDPGNKPRRRRVKDPPEFEEMAGKERAEAVELAANMSPSPLELAREYRRKKRLQHQPGSVRLPDTRT